ncbi:zinc finger homeobox protein 4-like [Stegodyphus dumicola]|uniref:zinc finger homeobox protein 4-like n=1 Tax=Stegodyphus dumicola TaxID=202533 RepID=UPI0015AB0241|nr:zinc finger homeobox protein 4-like [Stegodyphus dumicola]
MYSTPLSLLQLPPTALPEITQKLTQPGNTTARFSQDGKTLEDLKGVVSGNDYQQAAEAEVDVGYVCKKCQLVHPAEVLCVNHQRSSCFANKNAGDASKAILRLVQVQLECRACRERFPTLLDFKFHCNADRHVKRVHKLQRNEQMTPPNSMLPPNAMVPPNSIVPPKMPSCSTSSHFAATPVAPSMTPPRLAPPPLLLPQTGNDVTTRNGPDVTAQHLMFSSDFRNDLDSALRLGLEASSLDLPASSKAGLCFTGEASLSPETKRL